MVSFDVRINCSDLLYFVDVELRNALKEPGDFIISC